MAQLHVNNVTENSFRWSITGLGSNFTSSNYSSAGISTKSFTSGTTTRPAVLTYTQDYTNTTSTNSITYSHSLNEGTHTLYGFTNVSGKYYSCGTVTITVPKSYPKPSDWNWSYEVRNAMENNGSFNKLTATEWNNFVDNVTETLKWYHQKESGYDFSSAKVTKGEVFPATKFNTIKNAIGSLKTTGISDKYKGDTIKGEYFITLSLKLAEIKKMR